MFFIQFKKRTAFWVGLLICFAIIIGAFNCFSPMVTTFKTNQKIDKLEKALYKDYCALEGSYCFQLPDTWTSWTQSFSGGEILYHLNFRSNDKKINGFVQIWVLKKSLKDFIQESKTSAVGAVDFKAFNIKEIMAGNKQGYLLDYIRSNGKGQYYRGYEAFIEGKNGQIFRASFFVDQENWKEYYKIIFNRVVQSLRVK